MQDYNHYKWSLFEKVVVLFMNLIFSRCTFVQEGRYVKFSKKYLKFFGVTNLLKWHCLTSTFTNSFIVEECRQDMINDIVEECPQDMINDIVEECPQDMINDRAINSILIH